MKKSVKRVIEHLKQIGDPTIAAHSQRFFKTGKGEYGEGDKFLGIRVPIIRSEVKKHKALTLDETLQLLQSSLHEIRLFALIKLIDLYQQAEKTGKSEIYHAYLANYEYINNWDLVDTSAPHIVGDYLYQRSRAPLHELAKSDNLWRRRIAIIATLYFIKYNDFQDTLLISARLLKDKEDLIHKAVGWALREVGKRDTDMEEAFLNEHYRQMPRTMLRYAIEKFPEKKRKAYLAGTI